MQLLSLPRFAFGMTGLFAGTVAAVAWQRAPAVDPPRFEPAVTEPIALARPAVKHSDYCRREVANADGTRTLIVMTFDEQSRPIRRDVLDDGVLESRWDRTYERDGSVVTESWRIPVTNTTSDWRYRYDAAGREVEMTIDDDRDGIADSVYTRTYDAHGRLATYRENARPRSDYPGMLDVYRYDGGSDRILSITTHEAAGATSVTRFRYDARGRMVEERSPDAITRYTYDDADRVREAISVPTAEGAPGDITSYRYDAAGNLLETVNRSGGEVVQTNTYDYACW